LASILYFLPGATKEQVLSEGRLNVELLERFGLSETLADVRKWPFDCAVNEHRKGGPGGSNGGVLLAPTSKHNGPPSMLSYHAGHQIWLPTPKGAFAGIIKVDPPDCHDLERKVLLPGTSILDEHGRPWTVPIARSPHERYGALPLEFSFEGETAVGELQPRWQWLWELAGEFRDYFVREDEGYQRPPMRWLVENVLKVLAVNYRLGPTEINLLRECGRNPLSQSFVYRAASATVDFDVIVEAKKNSPESSDTPAENSSSSPPGDTADSPDTGPVGEP